VVLIPYLSGSYLNVTGTLNTTGVDLYIDIFVAIIIIASFYICYKSVLTDTIKDPHIDKTVEDKWGNVEDKEKYVGNVEEFLEDVEKEENRDNI
jgi:hypothetical protein